MLAVGFAYRNNPILIVSYLSYACIINFLLVIHFAPVTNCVFGTEEVIRVGGPHHVGGADHLPGSPGYFYATPCCISLDRSEDFFQG